MEPWAELVVLALAGIRASSLLARPAARREIAGRPRLAACVAVAGALGLGGLGWIATASIAWLRVITAAGAIGWAGLTWRARPSFGRARRLPPGSLALGASLDAIVDRDFYVAQARRHGPVFKMAQFHRPVACVVGLERSRRLLREHGHALVAPPLPLSTEIPKGFLRYMAPADYRRYGPLFRAAFSDAALVAVEPIARLEAERAFAALAAASRVRPAIGVAPRDTIDEHLLDVLLRLYFGELLHAGDRAIVARCSADANYANAVGRPSPQAKAALHDFMALVAARGAVPAAREDASVWGELVRLEPAAASDPTITGNLFILLQASLDSIGGCLAWMLHMLSTVPDWVEAARTTAPDDRDDPLGRAVIETLRLAQSEYVYREVRAAVPVDGFVVPRGWLVRLCVAEAHRQDPPFVDPDSFDPDRHRSRRYASAELAPFGLDQHACLGEHVTLALGRTFAERLVHGFSCEVVSNGPRERGNRHWNHWRPSAAFRIVLTPRT